MLIDLHTHTIASGHGSSDTINEMAKEASLRHLTLLGISDHAPAIMGSAKASYFRSLKHAPRKRFSLPVLFGAEINIIDYNGSLDLDNGKMCIRDSGEGAGDAGRVRRRRRCARLPQRWRSDDDLHRVPGPAAHDPQHVQDRGLSLIHI